MRSKNWLLAGLFFVSAICKVTAQVKFSIYALTGVAVIDVEAGRILEHQTIIIKGQKIFSIIDDRRAVIADSVPRIPLNGKYIIPGLIDSHVHLATDPSATKRSTVETTLEKMLRSGITTVRDMAGDARMLAGLARDAKLNEVVSPDIFYSALMAGPGFFSDPRTETSTAGEVSGHVPYMLGITDSTDLALAVAAAKGTGATGVKLYADLTSNLVRKVVTECKHQGMLTWSHAFLQASKPGENVRAGINVLSHASLFVYERFPDKSSLPANWKSKTLADSASDFWDGEERKLHLDTIFNLMKTQGTILDATLITYQSWAKTDPHVSWTWFMGESVVRQAHKMGVKISVGTDTDQEIFMQEEMKALVNYCHFTTMDAIISATKVGAETIGEYGSRGSVTANKLADLVILNENPVVDLNGLGKVYGVIKDGILFKNQ